MYGLANLSSPCLMRATSRLVLFKSLQRLATFRLRIDGVVLYYFFSTFSFVLFIFTAKKAAALNDTTNFTPTSSVTQRLVPRVNVSGIYCTSVTIAELVTQV